MRKYILFTDGGARGNPGPAGLGVAITDGDEKVLKKYSKFIGKRTNNQAEYEALILGLGKLKKIVKSESGEYSIEVRMDSELIINQLKGVYKVKNEGLKPLYEKVQKILDMSFPDVTFTHIPRSKNSIADALANKAMDKGDK